MAILKSLRTAVLGERTIRDAPARKRLRARTITLSPAQSVKVTSAMSTMSRAGCLAVTSPRSQDRGGAARTGRGRPGTVMPGTFASGDRGGSEIGNEERGA